MQSILQNASAVLSDSISALIVNILFFIPRALFALVVLALGIFLARVVYSSFLSFCRAINLDKIFGQLGLQSFFHEAGIDFSISHIVAWFFKFFIMFVAVVYSLSLLGFESVVNFIQFGLLPLIPTVLNVAIMLFLTFFIARKVSAFLMHTSIVAKNFSPIIAKASSWIIIFVGVLTVLDYLKIAEFLISFVNIILAAVLFAFALAAGLSFGLGCREEARCIVRGWMGKDCDDLECGCETDLHMCCPCDCEDCDPNEKDCACCDLEADAK
jgi:hypothetical protein